MSYILKTSADQLATTVDLTVSTRGLRDGERVFVWTDDSRPRLKDGKLMARGTIVSHRYDGNAVTVRVRLDGSPSTREILTSSLDDHKGSSDPILGPIAKVRSNTVHRVFEVETDEAANFLEDSFQRERS